MSRNPAASLGSSHLSMGQVGRENIRVVLYSLLENSIFEFSGGFRGLGHFWRTTRKRMFLAPLRVWELAGSGAASEGLPDGG